MALLYTISILFTSSLFDYSDKNSESRTHFGLFKLWRWKEKFITHFGRYVAIDTVKYSKWLHLSNSTELSSSQESTSCSASLHILRILWNPNVQFPFHSSPELVSKLSRSIQSMRSSYVFKINFNITLPSTLRSSRFSLSLSFLHENPACKLST